jgi:outer membrane receptor protein involved in Fe transport
VWSRREAVVDEPALRNGHVDDERNYDVLGFRLDARYSSQRWLHRAGLDVRSLSARYAYSGQVDYATDYPFPGAQDFVRVLSPAPAGEHVAAYYTVRTQLGEAITGEFGLRWDEQTYGVDADDQLAPRVNLAWRLGDGTRLLASWGRYVQFQGIEELQVEDGIDEFHRAQHADHAILGFEHDFAAALTVRVEAYRKNYERLRTRFENLYDPLSLAPELRWDRTAISPESARAEGVESLLSFKQWGHWNGWLSYTWSHAVDRFATADVRRSWDQSHTLNAGLGWTGGPWQATVAAQHHTGWPVTPIGLDTQGNVVLGERNDRRYADYAALDARVSYEWILPRGTLTAHFDVTNSLDRRNPCCTDLEYARDAGGTATLERELRHWLPLIPSAGVLWKF